MSNYYKITFEQKQPLHLWIWNFGVVAESRNFLLPHQFVSAVLNANNIWNSDYSIEKNLDDIINNVSIFKPQCLDFDNEKEFNKNYKQTFVSTAVNPWTRWAKDESLHEIEYISNTFKKEERLKSMEWKWYIRKDFEIDWINFEDLKWKEIYLWGEFKYWFGLCKIKKIHEEIEENIKKETKNKYFLHKIENKNTQTNNYKKILPLTLRLTKSSKKIGHNFIYKGFFWF